MSRLLDHFKVEEPFFKPTHGDITVVGPGTTWFVELEEANRKVEPLLAEIEYLHDFLQTATRESLEANQALELERQKCHKACNELIRLTEEIHEAPTVYMSQGFGHYDTWTANLNDLDSHPTHQARIVRIEEIRK